MRIAILVGVIIVLIAAILVLGSTLEVPAQNQEIETNTNTNTEQNQIEEKRELTLYIYESGGSGEEGVAEITEADGRAKVELQVIGGPSNISQPAYIQAGTCDSPGEIKFSLNSVRNGISETILPVSYEQLMSQVPLLVSIRKSLSEMDKFIACGNMEEF